MWASANASPEGAFEIERRLTGDTAWAPIELHFLADQVSHDGLLHFEDAIPDSTVGKARTYRVRYAYGGDHSAYSNEITLTGWQDTDLDGLPDAWELANFGTLSFNAGDPPGTPRRDPPGDRVGDADGDGYSNIAEFNAHTNPNALSANAPGSTLIVYTHLE